MASAIYQHAHLPNLFDGLGAIGVSALRWQVTDQGLGWWSVQSASNAAWTAAEVSGSIHPPLSSLIFPSIGPEDSVPKEIDHCEITVRVSVMNEVQLLFSSEPRKPLKSRSFYVVFLVEKDVRVERRRTSNYLNHEEIEWQ